VGDYRCVIPAWQLLAVLGEGGPGGVEPVRFTDLPGAVFEPEGRLAAQDRGGVVAEVLYPTPRVWGAIGLVLDAKTEIACARVYNEWLAEFVRPAPDRLVGVGVIPAHGGVDVAVEQLRRVSELGLRGVHLRAFPSGPLLTSEADKFWLELVNADLVVSFDASFGPSIGRSSGRGIMTTGPEDAVAQFVYQGVVERFPTMRYVISMPTAGWVPAWLERLDDGYLRFPAAQNTNLTRGLPSDYLRTRPFFTFSGQDLILDYPDDYIAFSHLMWSSQYPTFHALEAAESFSQLSGLDPATHDAIRGGTCRGLYGLPDGAQIDFDPVVNPLPHAIPT
jgi:predicted TIM-barrel fold metal-dependent hydrolase